MPRVDAAKEAEIKRAIRIAIAKDPLISARRLQQALLKEGFKTYRDAPLDIDYVLKLVKKVNAEGAHDIKDSEIESRMTETRERFRVTLERLFKIAFWEWDYLKDGIGMPEVRDQVKALEAIMKMDIALLQAEMDAGIFKRSLGTLEIEKRNAPLTPERKLAIIEAFRKQGIAFLQTSPPSSDASETPVTQPAAAQ